MENQTFDIAVAGHFAIDTIRLPSRSGPFIVLGGSVTYVSFVTRRLDATVTIISKVGKDFPEAYLWLLREEGIDVSYVVKLKKEGTTRFDLEYSKDLSNRTLKLENKAGSISLSNLPKSMQAKAVHIAPIAGEVSYEVVERLKDFAEVVSLDPQGLLRRFDKRTGKVTYSSSVGKELFSLINVYKSSLEEIIAITGKTDINAAINTIHDLGVKTVIVTLGAQGAVLSVEKTVYNIPACNSKALVDPTGAGDAFIGGFLTEYIRQKDSFWCACVGSAAASMVIEGVGPTSFGEKEEIYQRARSIYEKEIKP
ncbi:carbohydrate kinase family protein [Candidatus Bathyarchaeota archaeon]|nr:carbohydrate kinase family protein [Candidatus Bathyarchaeota archaeon]